MISEQPSVLVLVNLWNNNFSASIYEWIALLSSVNLFVRHKHQRKLSFRIVNEVHKMCQRLHQQLFVRRRPLDYGRMARRCNRLFVFVAKRNWCSSIPIMLYMLLLVSSLEVHFHQIFDSITKIFFANINLYIIKSPPIYICM